MRRLSGLATGLAVAWLVVSTGAVTAHAVLVKATPAARSVIAQSPARVAITFNERLEPAYSTISVWDARGAQVDLRDGRVAPDDRRRLQVGLPPLPPGAYTVRYRVLSVDGHIVEASYPFSVGAARR